MRHPSKENDMSIGDDDYWKLHNEKLQNTIDILKKEIEKLTENKEMLTIQCLNQS